MLHAQPTPTISMGRPQPAQLVAQGHTAIPLATDVSRETFAC